ncbi:class I SAM-dependent methyltransferase [Legionella impletisoli]|uniref:SAM-dependent methyltransferase n=1 Tax=Legionella impletisoli TaxID=343510 RepID=A0A917N9U0_9GAMM|nr:class I SAM-dependent methyltransferase [Legionella impletisoli]GGI81556.1 SAM-dependent methyltransferase [Legionella impletisoli]
MKHLNITEALHDYILDKSLREHPVQEALREETAKMPLAIMQISPIQAQFMQLLIRLLNAQRVLELGTFTGYSALSMALALPDNGKLITCDLNEEWTNIAKPYWEEAGQANKIELRLGPALSTMQQLLNEGLAKQFDLIFIDADKTNYMDYYELSLALIRPHGLILIDNVLWHGKVIDESETGGQTREIRRLNDFLKEDERVHISMLPIADGLFLVQPKI